MRKIILMIAAVLASITFAYAESCSSGQGSLSYQISGCGDQARACCTGQWCSWGTTSCASCTDTTQACSGNVSNACAGNRTRSVTGSCGSSCTYGSWSDSGCSYTQSCTATSESRNCSGNVTNACAGTQTRTRTVKDTCGSCSYNSWGSWSTSGCSYTQSCTATSESRNCSGNVSGACAGTQSRSRSVTGTCGSCSYSGWSGWDTSGCTAYTYRPQQYTYAAIGTGSNTVEGLSKDDSYMPNDKTNYHPVHIYTTTGITPLAFLRNRIEYMEGKVACRTGITTGCCNKAFDTTSYPLSLTPSNISNATVSHGYAITCTVYRYNTTLAFCYCPNYVPIADCV